MALCVLEIALEIKKQKGNISAVARHFGVARQSLYERLQKSVKLRQSLREARETMLDEAENWLYERMQNSDTLLIFYLKTQGKNRGYIEQASHVHSGNLEISWKDIIYATAEDGKVGSK